METFKALEFIEEKERNAFGRYVHLINDTELGGCDIPQLMKIGVSIRKLKKMYPKQDFKGVRLVILKVSEIQTNKA